MKYIAIILLLMTLGGLSYLIYSEIYANYEWNDKVYSNWSLSDKSSTLVAKADYMDKFLTALKSEKLADNNALIYKTADNNCKNNIDALNTLKQRLDEIKTMDTSSFEYQQAIQQITQQEQGEAYDLISTLRGCWYKTNHYYLWNVWLLCLYLALTVLGVVLTISFFVSGY